MANESAVVPLEDIQVDSSLNYIKRPVAILDRKTKTLRNKVVQLVKVQWQHRKGSKWTWESEGEMREHYPELFLAATAAEFEDEVLDKLERVVMPHLWYVIQIKYFHF